LKSPRELLLVRRVVAKPATAPLIVTKPATAALFVAKPAAALRLRPLLISAEIKKLC